MNAGERTTNEAQLHALMRSRKALHTAAFPEEVLWSTWMRDATSSAACTRTYRSYSARGGEEDRQSATAVRNRTPPQNANCGGLRVGQLALSDETPRQGDSHRHGCCCSNAYYRRKLVGSSGDERKAQAQRREQGSPKKINCRLNRLVYGVRLVHPFRSTTERKTIAHQTPRVVEDGRE